MSGSESLFTDAEMWMLYDLVASQKQAHDDAELYTRSNCGGEPWRLLHRKLRVQVERIRPEIKP